MNREIGKDVAVVTVEMMMLLAAKELFHNPEPTSPNRSTSRRSHRLIYREPVESKTCATSLVIASSEDDCGDEEDERFEGE